MAKTNLLSFILCKKIKCCEKWLRYELVIIIVKEMHIILKVLPDSNWPSVTCLMICINRNLRLISALRNGWKLISPSKSFVVYAATSTEKHQWMSHIKKCVDDLLIKRMYPVLASMPVWFFPPKNKKPILLQYQCHSWRSRSFIKVNVISS